MQINNLWLLHVCLNNFLLWLIFKSRPSSPRVGGTLEFQGGLQRELDCSYIMWHLVLHHTNHALSSHCLQQYVLMLLLLTCCEDLLECRVYEITPHKDQEIRSMLSLRTGMHDIINTYFQTESDQHYSCVSYTATFRVCKINNNFSFLPSKRRYYRKELCGDIWISLTTTLRIEYDCNN